MCLACLYLCFSDPHCRLHTRLTGCSHIRLTMSSVNLTDLLVRLSDLPVFRASDSDFVRVSDSHFCPDIPLPFPSVYSSDFIVWMLVCLFVRTFVWLFCPHVRLTLLSVCWTDMIGPRVRLPVSSTDPTDPFVPLGDCVHDWTRLSSGFTGSVYCFSSVDRLSNGLKFQRSHPTHCPPAYSSGHYVRIFVRPFCPYPSLTFLPVCSSDFLPVRPSGFYVPISIRLLPQDVGLTFGPYTRLTVPPSTCLTSYLGNPLTFHPPTVLTCTP